MGCDIHAHIEVKINGRWEHWTKIAYIGRYYSFFERIAGVRGSSEKAISPPKGLPKDVNPATQSDNAYWDSDGHSHTWLTSHELTTVLKEFPEKTKEIFGDYYDVETMDKFDFEDWRFICWFDN